MTSLLSPLRPRLAVVKLSSCDGCQLTLLDCEDELLAVAAAVDIAWFPEASSDMRPGPYEIGLVEGSVTTPHDLELLQQLREDAKVLVAIGACATAGGIQALRNFADVAEYAALVYAKPEVLHALATSTPVSDHVKVDYELRGCPIDKGQLLELLTALLHGRRPRLPAHSVCMQCKQAGQVCVTVARGVPCLGPVTHAGCGGLCPGYARGCFGCFGPSDAPNPRGMSEVLRAHGLAGRALVDAWRGYASAAPAFADESRRVEEEGR